MKTSETEIEMSCKKSVPVPVVLSEASQTSADKQDLKIIFHQRGSYIYPREHLVAIIR